MGQALRLAFDLMQLPSQVRFVRAAPLPDDVPVLLGIAAGDAETIRQATRLSGRSRDDVTEAAGFFIEQILLFPDADSYRVLGATSRTSNGELRRHMALLLRWLHPDLDPQGERIVFARKVTRAWNDLKTPERRAAYDQSMRNDLEKMLHKTDSRNGRRRGSSRRPHNGHAKLRAYRRSLRSHPDRHPGLLRRVLLMLFGRAVY